MSRLGRDIREIISYYPFSDMSDVTKGYVKRLADRADDLAEELAIYRDAFRLVNDAQLKQAKRLARMRYPRKTGPEQGEQVMPKVDGKSFRCECGANVFTRVGDHEYLCNGCRAHWQGEPKIILMRRKI